MTVRHLRLVMGADERMEWQTLYEIEHEERERERRRAEARRGRGRRR